MLRARQFGLLLALGLVGFASPAARADEMRVALKDVPDAVREAAQRAAPDTRWVKATKETDDDETSYVVKGASAKNLKVSVSINGDGSVEEVESALSLSELPKDVAHIVKSLPDYLWDSGNQTVHDNETSYELYGSDLEDREVTLSIDAEGKAMLHTTLKIEEVPADVSAALKARLPNFAPESVVSIADKGVVVRYEFEGKGLDDESKVTVSADGKTIKVGDDDDDDANV